MIKNLKWSYCGCLFFYSYIKLYRYKDEVGGELYLNRVVVLLSECDEE